MNASWSKVIFRIVVILAITSTLCSLECFSYDGQESTTDEGVTRLYQDLSKAGLYLAGRLSLLNYTEQRYPGARLRMGLEDRVLDLDNGGMTFDDKTSELTGFSFGNLYSEPPSEKTSSINDQNAEALGVSFSFLGLPSDYQQVEAAYGDRVMEETYPGPSLRYYLSIETPTRRLFWVIAFFDDSAAGGKGWFVAGYRVAHKELRKVPKDAEFKTVRVDREGKAI